ncbi:MAG: hydrogenase formation protein HypD [Pseudomonadota bacterium]
MALKYREEYRDPRLARGLIENIMQWNHRDVRLMEVCGTHTTSIFKSGIRSALPPSITLLSGPGCPVCVTAQGEIDAFIELSRRRDVIITTFGDLMRVPGQASSLQRERADGSDIRVVYSTNDALEIAADNPGKKVVFLGVGFETTAPTIAASILAAEETGISNFSVFSAHKLVPPALDALMKIVGLKLDGLILPGHVSVIIGEKAYGPLVKEYGMPCAIAGFEPVDILQAISHLLEQIKSGKSKLENCYPRAVGYDGNIKARQFMETVFETVHATWRGLGEIPYSGLGIREDFASFDARRIFDVAVNDVEEPKGCACGQILTGMKTHPECPLYRKVCTPMDPVGPCMVSSEGTCAAYYR